MVAGWRVDQDTNVLESLNRVWEENVTAHAAGKENPLTYLYALFVEIPTKFSRTLHDAVARDVNAASDSIGSWTRVYGRELAEYLASLPSRLRDVVTSAWDKSTDLLVRVVQDSDDVHVWHVGTREVLLDGKESKCACPAFLGNVVADKHILAVLRVTGQWSHLARIRRPPTHILNEDVRARCARLMNQMAENERILRARRFAGTGGVQSISPDVPAAPGRATPLPGGAMAHAHVPSALGTQGGAALFGSDAPDPRTARNVLVEGLHALSSEIRNQDVSTERLQLIEEMLDRGRRDSGVPVSVTLAALSSCGGRFTDTGVFGGEGAVSPSGWILVPAFEDAPAFEFNPASGARRAVGEHTGKRARVAAASMAMASQHGAAAGECIGDAQRGDDDATRVSRSRSTTVDGFGSSTPEVASAKRGNALIEQQRAASGSRKRAKVTTNSSGTVGAVAGDESASAELDSAGVAAAPHATPVAGSRKRSRAVGAGDAGGGCINGGGRGGGGSGGGGGGGGGRAPGGARMALPSPSAGVFFHRGQSLAGTASGGGGIVGTADYGGYVSSPARASVVEYRAKHLPAGNVEDLVKILMGYDVRVSREEATAVRSSRGSCGVFGARACVCVWGGGGRVTVRTHRCQRHCWLRKRISLEAAIGPSAARSWSA